MLTRHVQRTTMILGAVIAALLFFLCGAALRLAMGPIALDAFSGAIEEALNGSVSGLVIRFDQAVLEWSRADGKINVTVLGTRVFDLDGRIIAQAPKADIGFDAAEMFLGHLRPKSFALIGVQLTGIRSHEGMIRLGFGMEDSNTNLIDLVRSVLQDGAETGGSLQSFSIKDARVAFRDEVTGLFVVAPGLSLTLQNKGDHLDTAVNSRIEITGVPADLTLRAVLRGDGSVDHGTLDLSGLSLAALAANSKSFSYLTPYRLVSNLNASFQMDETGDLTASQFRLTSAGSVAVSFLKSPLSWERMTFEGSYDAKPHRLRLNAVNLEGRNASAKGAADLVLGFGDAGLRTISGAAELTRVALDLPELFAQPVAFSLVSVKGAYDEAARRLTVDRLQLQQNPLVAEFNGAVTLAAHGSPAIRANGQVGMLAARDILKYWPLVIGKGARAWIDDNILDGHIGPIKISADLKAGAFGAADGLADDALSIRFPFEGMTARYMRGIDPLVQAKGEATLTGDMFEASIASATAGPLPVSGGDVKIADLHAKGTPARILAHAEGRMANVLKLIDEQPLGFARRFGIDPATAEGFAAIDLDFSVPTLRTVTLDQIRIGVKAKVADLSLPIDKRRKLEHAAANFVIDGKALSSEGSGLLSSVPVRFAWTEEFAAKETTTVVRLSGKLDDASRTALGLSEPAWVRGPIGVSLLMTGHRFHFKEAALKADLTEASGETPTLKIAKAAGVPATATAQLDFLDGGGLAISNFALVGEGGLEVRGTMRFDAGGDFSDIALTTMRDGARNDFGIDFRPLPGNGLAVRIAGKSLDATRFFGSKADPRKPAADANSQMQNPFALTAKLDRLVLRDNMVAGDVDLQLSYAAHGRIVAFRLDAKGPGKGRITGRFRSDEKGRGLTLDAEDAGAFVRAFTGFSSLDGGRLATEVTFMPDKGEGDAKANPIDYQGTITLSDIVLMDQPFVARLFAAGSLDGPLRLLQNQGIALTKVEAKFSVHGKDVSIREGRASGPAIGASFAGMLDRDADRVDLAGTLVPVFGLNSMLGVVPILGDILVSKKGEGVFGLTYAMKGSLSEPTLAVNPLSVLTPGIFRRIFEFSTPKDPQAEAKAAPAPLAP